MIGERPRLILRKGRLASCTNEPAQTVDVAIGQNGCILAIEPAIETTPGATVAELGGRLIVPGLVDVHQHLDKTRTREAVSNPDGTLTGAVHAYNAYAQTVSTSEIIARAEKTIAACVARGTTAIRTHVNVGPDTGITGLEALAAVRDRNAERVKLQLVALLPPDPASVRKWSAEAAAVGVQAMGGAPAHAADPDDCLAAIFDAAEQHGIDVDLHLDEHLDAARHLFRQLAQMTLARGMQGHVIAGHCSAFGAIPLPEAQPIIEAFAASGIGVVTLPAANLYLLGRDRDCLIPRGLTRVSHLISAGAQVACASDNIQDPFVPTGTGDLLEMARWLMLAGHLGSDQFGTALATITSAPARIMHLAEHGIRVGARADLVLAAADNVADLIASGPLDRTVLFGGKVVAGSLQFLPMHEP